MQRLPSVLCGLVLACAGSGPGKEVTKVGEDEQVDDRAENVKLASDGTPWFVMLGGSGSHTTKPVANAVLAHSWGWGTASAADRAACEAKASRPGELMACSSEGKPEGAAELLAELGLAAGKSAFVTAEQIADWKSATPTGSVWLFGPTQACKATVGRPLVGWYSIYEFSDDEDEAESPDLSDEFIILELAWELTGCEDANETWAPIGMAAGEFEPTARWVPMKTGERRRFEPASWTGVLASDVAKLPSAAKSFLAGVEVEVSGPEWWTQTFELPGTDIREIWFAAAWRGPESAAPDEYECDDVEFGEVFQIRQAADEVTSIGRGSRGQLVGALVAGDEVLTMVWTDTLDYSAAKLVGAELGASIELSSGVYHSESGEPSTYTLLPYCGP